MGKNTGENRLYIVDLFCGMGGFSCGAVQAGAEVVLAIDSWKEALDAHRLNHPRCIHVQMTLGGQKTIQTVLALIRRFVPPYARWHLHGSPPCQAFSSANRHKRTSADRGMILVKWYLSLVEAAQPNSWSMEQVRGAINHLPCQNFQSCSIVNATDYGIAQTRKRLFVGDGWILPPPATRFLEHPVGVGDVLPDLFKEGTHLRGYSTNRAISKNGRYVGYRRLENHEEMRPLSMPSYTLCARPGLALYRKIRNKFLFVRNLSVREYMAIQGFPSQYIVGPNIATRTQYALVGNSVCPLIARFIVQSAMANANAKQFYFSRQNK